MAGWPIFGLMGNEHASGIYVVAATKDGQTELWAAATPRDEALKEVQQLLGPEWAVALTDQRVSPEQVTALALHPGGVRAARNPRHDQALQTPRVISPAAEGMVRRSKPAEQNQDQQDNDYEAKATAAVIAGPIKGPASKPTKSAEQNDNQNDQQDCSE